MCTRILCSRYVNVVVPTTTSTSTIRSTSTRTVVYHEVRARFWRGYFYRNRRLHSKTDYSDPRVRYSLRGEEKIAISRVWMKLQLRDLCLTKYEWQWHHLARRRVLAPASPSPYETATVQYAAFWDYTHTHTHEHEINRYTEYTMYKLYYLD